MTLFHERGYANVTIADIAEHAGLTKRSFFNHFADKREVVFAGAAALEGEVRRHLNEADDQLAPMDLVVAALTLAGADLSRYGEFSTIRRDIISSATELQERSLIKSAKLSAALQSGLRARGFDASTAFFVSDAAVRVFNFAYDSWGEQPSAEFSTLMQRYLADLREAIRAPAIERPGDRAREEHADGGHRFVTCPGNG